MRYELRAGLKNICTAPCNPGAKSPWAQIIPDSFKAPHNFIHRWSFARVILHHVVYERLQKTEAFIAPNMGENRVSLRLFK